MNPSIEIRPEPHPIDAPAIPEPSIGLIIALGALVVLAWLAARRAS